MSKGTEILTKRLALLPYVHPEQSLVKIHTGWMHDPEVLKYSENRHRNIVWSENKRYIKSFDHQTSFLWAILDKRVKAHQYTPWDDFYLGHVAGYGDPPNQSVELAILIGERSIWGRGYGCEAWRGALDLLMAQGTRKVFAGCMSANRGMVRIMEKSGLMLEGRRRDHLLLDGIPTDFVQYAKFQPPKP